jgi:hypothetical protein
LGEWFVGLERRYRSYRAGSSERVETRKKSWFSVRAMVSAISSWKALNDLFTDAVGEELHVRAGGLVVEGESPCASQDPG